MFNEKYESDGEDLSFNIGIIHVVLYFAIILILEILYKLYNRRRPQLYKVPKDTMTLSDFNHRVLVKRESLCILDDLVLDVTDYMDNHPGGKFLISHTVGTDISKYFYGGYSLDGNLVPGQLKRHNHTNASRVQVDTMAVARLIPD
jgi:hypothetical protein